MQYFIEVATNSFTRPTKIGSNYPIPNIVTDCVQKHGNLLLDTHMNGVFQKATVSKKFTKMEE
jgi:hypothetical protein